MGATFGIVGSGVTAAAAPNTALERAGLAVMLPRFVTVMTAIYCPLAFVVSDCRVEEICTTGAATVRLVPLETPPRAAVMVDVPALSALARPAEFIEAMAGVPEVHVTVVVRFWVVPSL